ncbi:MAG TPA: ribosome small subunit-dependent GTPase A [Bacilli bacterium]|jgi:ribosome small subunit-dependent GTPase A|nr:ribosome small subunit-dependent GTPase A [Bacilli bacterium]
MQGKIIRIISNLYTVKCSDGKYDCQARGKFRNDKITPLVGDDCIIDKDNKYILEILPRKNELKRPLVSNIDTAVIVTSIKQPDLSLNLLDKMLSIITINKIKPIICFTKLDLADKNDKKLIKQLKKYYESINIPVLNNKKIGKLKRCLKNQVVVFTGQTGAGKSSLLNKIDKTLNLKTGEISMALNRGKHTTRHVELFELNNTYIVDTPGFSALDFNDISDEQIKDSFVEFGKYNCKFNNCMHINEKECKVKDAIENQQILLSRYENYKSFVKRK